VHVFIAFFRHHLLLHHPCTSIKKFLLFSPNNVMKSIDTYKRSERFLKISRVKHFYLWDPLDVLVLNYTFVIFIGRVRYS
jgi:hypothetical protein